MIFDSHGLRYEVTDHICCSDGTTYAPAVPPATRMGLDYMRAQICVTHLCNFHCIYCNLDNGKQYVNKLMSRETGRAIIDYILANRPLNIKNVLISLTSNGETLTNMDTVLDIVKYSSQFKDVAFSFNFATNATLLTRDILEKLKDFGNVSMFFSLDGNRRIHNLLRPYQNNAGSYDDVLKGIRLYMDVFGKSTFPSSTVITTYNTDIAGIYSLLNQLGSDYIVARPVRGPASWQYALSEKTYDVFKSAYGRFFHQLKEDILGARKLISLMAPGYDFFGKYFYVMLLGECRNFSCPHCPPDVDNLKFFSTTYDVDGTIYAPCRDLIGYPGFCIGSVFSNGSTDEGVYSYTCEKSHICKICDFRHICGGACLAQSYYANQDYKVPDETMCHLIKYVIKLAAELIIWIKKTDPILLEKLADRGRHLLSWRSCYNSSMPH